MHSLDRIAGLTCAALFLSGCAAVGPDFKTPELHPPETWTAVHAGAPELAVVPGEGVRLNWKQADDPVLQALIAQGGVASADLRIAAIRFAEARSQRAATAAGTAPQLNASAFGARQKQSAYGAGTRILDALDGPNKESTRRFLGEPFNVYDAGFDFSWEIDLWGRVRRSIEGADAAVDQQDALLRQTRLALQAEIARAYVDLRLAQTQLRLARETLRSAEANLMLVNARSVAGLVPAVDAVQQRGFVAEQRARIPGLQQQEAFAMNQLTLLCEKLPGALSGKLGAADVSILDLQAPALDLGVPSELAARRPDIQAALAELHQATAGIGVAVADLYPRIRLGANAGFESLMADRFGDWATRKWSIGPSLDLPVFDGGRRRAVVQLRELQQQESAVRFQHTVLKAWHEVDDAVSDYNAERMTHADVLDRLASARTSLAVARQRYATGLASFIAVLDAQRTATDAEAAYARHQAHLWSTWIAVLKSLGVQVDGD